MEAINLYEAKTQLSQLVERAAAGEEIVIAKAGRPMARLMPLALKPMEPRKLGQWAHEGPVDEAFDDPLPEEILRAFNGESP
jgi:prevent-host-death family protein